jgi:SAM-dependent methyltransferase
LSIDNIDWNEVWRDGVLFYAGQSDNAAVWDSVSASMNAALDKGNYGQNVFNRIKNNPEWSVLDIGCGPGLLVIPLAKSFKRVTALDVSSEMLRYVQQNAAKEELKNITCVNKGFEYAVIGTDVKQHDVVIASRSMGYVKDLKQFLLNMNAAAKRYAYLTWGTDDRPFDIGVYKAIGRPYGDTRSYIVIYNLLVQLGIKANIELFDCDMGVTPQNNIESALNAIKKRFKDMHMGLELTKEEEVRLIPYLEEKLTINREGIPQIAFHNNIQNIALIWWEPIAVA